MENGGSLTDRIPTDKRSALMSRVRTKHTAPELAVRRALHAAGLRFRLHRRDLPGKPDIVLGPLRTAIFVHGCFWHGHDCTKGSRRPQSNVDFWNGKLDRNMERDRVAADALRAAGWNVEVVWECSLAESLPALVEHLRRRRSDLRE